MPYTRRRKSRTAANLAVVLAQAGYSTVLIDADFRRPSQHRIFGRIRNVGLSNLIVQDMPESAVYIPDEQVKELVVMASGPTPPNPSELLGSAGAQTPVRDLAQRHLSQFIASTEPPGPLTRAWHTVLPNRPPTKTNKERGG